MFLEVFSLQSFKKKRPMGHVKFHKLKIALSRLLTETKSTSKTGTLCVIILMPQNQNQIILGQKLSGRLEHLRRTVSFVRESGLIIWSYANKKKKKQKPSLELTQERTTEHIDKFHCTSAAMSNITVKFPDVPKLTNLMTTTAWNNVFSFIQQNPITLVSNFKIIWLANPIALISKYNII